MDQPGIPGATVCLVGKVILESQRFEEGLKYLLLFNDLKHGRSISEEEQLARIADRTRARSHLAAARNGGLISEEAEGVCNAALGGRDAVVHRLMREWGQQLATAEGRAAVHAYVAGVHDQIQLATSAIAPPLVVAGHQLGLTAEQMDSWYRRARHPAHWDKPLGC